MNLSVCIITKNEAEKLEKCLKSLKNYDVEIVVVDTGSTDNTKEIIKTYADKTGSFEWCNDFSKARNYSISLALYDWILVLDTDEWIEEMNPDEVAKILENAPKTAGRIERINQYKINGNTEFGHERICRLFHKQYYEYRGRIHEQVTRKDKSPEQYADVPIRIGHSGYDGTEEERIEKAARNIKLLLMDLEEYGDEPYTLYQLGKSYYMQKDYEKACMYFERGLGFDLEPGLEYVQDMVETYAYALMQMKRFEEMLFLKNIYKEFAVSADYVFLTGLAYMNNAMFKEAIEEFEKAVQHTYCKVEGCNSYKAYYNAGVICECLGDISKARQYYEKCSSYELAQEGLKRLK